MNIDDLMRQAGLEAIADKDSRAAAGQEMTSPEQDRYHAASYFAWLVSKAARVQALEEAVAACASRKGTASMFITSRDAMNHNTVVNECIEAIRLLGEDAGRGES